MLERECRERLTVTAAPRLLAGVVERQKCLKACVARITIARVSRSAFSALTISHLSYGDHAKMPNIEEKHWCRAIAS
jgi:hypothetical protein